jgi:hypothetical protein
MGMLEWRSNKWNGILIERLDLVRITEDTEGSEGTEPIGSA